MEKVKKRNRKTPLFLLCFTVWKKNHYFRRIVVNLIIYRLIKICHFALFNLFLFIFVWNN